MKNRLFSALIPIVLLLGCASEKSVEEIIPEEYSLSRADEEVWQINSDSEYYQYFNKIHQTYDSLIRATTDPEEIRRLFIERDLKVAEERLNYMADGKLVRKVIGGTENKLGANASGHMFRKWDIYKVPRQGFTPRNPAEYTYKELEPMFSTKGSDAMTAIIQFDRQLKKRGVQLIVVPVPNSAQVYAHQLDNGINMEDVVWHPWAHMIVKLLEYDVEVLDLLDLYKSYSGDNTVLGYLDHHWGQAGLDIVGREMAQRFQRFHFDKQYYLEPSKFKREKIMVDMPALIPYWDHQDVSLIRHYMPVASEYETVRITYEGDEIDPAPSFEDSPVLIMGDSFIFHHAEYSAGIYANLAYYTHIIPAQISRNAAAAKPPEWYMTQIAGKGKEPKVVIWEIYGSAFNEVTNLNDWKVVKMPDPEKPVTNTVSKKKDSQQKRSVEWIKGEVIKVSELPAIEDLSTYPDALYAYKIKVTDPQSSKLPEGKTLVVYSQFLEDYEAIKENVVQAGDTLELFVEEWSEVSKANGKLSTMQLVDDLEDYESEIYYSYVNKTLSGI